MNYRYLRVPVNILPPTAVDLVYNAFYPFEIKAFKNLCKAHGNIFHDSKMYRWSAGSDNSGGDKKSAPVISVSTLDKR